MGWDGFDVVSGWGLVVARSRRGAYSISCAVLDMHMWRRRMRMGSVGSVVGGGCWIRTDGLDCGQIQNLNTINRALGSIGPWRRISGAVRCHQAFDAQQARARRRIPRDMPCDDGMMTGGPRGLLVSIRPPAAAAPEAGGRFRGARQLSCCCWLAAWRRRILELG